jgi:hypothetical protein
MFPRLVGLALLFTLSSLWMAGCGLSGENSPRETPVDAVLTSAAQTLMVELTPSPTVSTPEPSPTASPFSPDFTATSPASTSTPSSEAAVRDPSPTRADPTATSVVITSRPSPTSTSPASAAPRAATATPFSFSQTGPTASARPTEARSIPSATASPAPTNVTPTGQPTQQVEVLLSDDFETEQAWFQETRPEYSFRYDQGGYIIGNHFNAWHVPSLRTFDLQDVIMEVEVRQLSGQAESFAGLLCRWQDEEIYYAFLAAPDGSYGIAYVAGGEMNYLEQGLYEDGFIVSGRQSYLISVSCLGSQLTLSINGEVMAEVTDDRIPGSGLFGLLTSNTAGPSEFLFDNFLLARP